ncbi:DUF349 domain-containing protein [Cellulophaga sp. Hel_I_12]|uniref:DUF349 domain-containing protein n=1 Tax=Cellulophaga sp. Hel_I_12 TaxID=1249972 RepID=UPI0006456677|nr:DUF349 domain-containing protein [Cellulophaga sp. Hel_I_12]
MLDEKDDTLQNNGSNDQTITSKGDSREESEIDKTEATGNETVNEEKTAENKPEVDKKPNDELLNEIDDSNAEDAEDTDNHQRHVIPVLDYHALSMENLVGELQRLVKNEKVQAIKKHVDGIKYEFDLKFQEFIDQKKEEFIENGGQEIDFKYNSVTKRQYNEVYSEYREKRNQYYKSLEKSLKDNLENRLQIIEDLKGLVTIEEDINTTYKSFKDLQESWRQAGPIPRNNYNDVWRTYHHHIEIFYDFLHLNRELRDLDFKRNLEEKEKLADRAEALEKVEDLNTAFQELQTLHKIWKEDIGPVDKQHREAIWERFSNATKALHNRRQDYYAEIEKTYEVNLVKKTEIIASIDAITAKVANNHKGLQQQIKEIEILRNEFFGAGKVPQKVNEKTWATFKNSVRAFNRKKNNFYKDQKKEQQDNLDKKRALLDLALRLKDSENSADVTSEMKRIQNEWKQIGHVPRKYSDKIWKQFKDACNHYFNKLHASKNEAQKEELENFEQKNKCLERLQAFTLSGERTKDLEAIKGFIGEWKTYGRVPFNKKNINVKFNKILDVLFKKLDIDRKEGELLKYGNKIEQLSQNEDTELALQRERTFIRRKIDECKNEVRQFETNLQFFSNASEDSPVVKDVIKKINVHKEELATWKAKLKKLNIFKHTLTKESEEDAEKLNDDADNEV